MLEFLSDFERTFNIEINLDDIDKMVEEEKFITIQDVVEIEFINNFSYSINEKSYGSYYFIYNYIFSRDCH